MTNTASDPLSLRPYTRFKHNKTSLISSLGGWRGCFLFSLAFSICFQNIVLFNVGSAAIKPYHAVALVTIIVSIADKGSAWRLPPMPFTLAFISFVVISLVDTIFFRFNIIIINYAFFFIAIVAAYNLGSTLTKVAWVEIIRAAALCFFLALGVNIGMNHDAIIRFASDSFGGHPLVPSLFGGGVNLDASWLALFGVFFRRDLKGGLFLIGSLGISLLYASRVGLILSIFSILYVNVIQPRDFSAIKRVAMFLLAAVVVCIAMDSLGGIVVDRLLSIGADAGSIGRLNMWQYALGTFLNSPIIGYGAGNAIAAIEAHSGMLFAESNIHNYYLQVLLDFGIVGFVPFALLLCFLIVQSFHKRLEDSFEAYLLLWAVGALFQFRGPDAMLGFFIGAYFATRMHLNSKAADETTLEEVPSI